MDDLFGDIFDLNYDGEIDDNEESAGIGFISEDSAEGEDYDEDDY